MKFFANPTFSKSKSGNCAAANCSLWGFCGKIILNPPVKKSDIKADEDCVSLVSLW
jgi:hypothetical protein